MPPGLEGAFEIPSGPKDAFGNPVRQGSDEKTGWPLEIRHKQTGMHFVFIPAGKFMMGSPENEKDRYKDEGPVHKVKIPKPFYLGKYEVTVGQFGAFVKAASYRTDGEKEGRAYAWTGNTWDKVSGASWREPGFEQTDEHPVTEVSWNDAKALCEWMSKGGTMKVRLPSEARWEYACRAGTRTAYHWGDDPDDGKGWCNAADQSAKEQFKDRTVFSWDDGYVFTAPVGRFKANAFGLYDMHGNVWEWCEDGYKNSYEGAPKDGSIAADAANDGPRVLRGGSWHDEPRLLRAAYRIWTGPVFRINFAGLRLALDL
jgi:formylglycine-generating enzyme required for sulfatase activity